MNQNKISISKETNILFAFFIVGILTIFGVPIWISITIVFILAISWAYSRKISIPGTPAPTPATATVPFYKKINWTAVGAIAIIAVVIFLLYGPMLGYIKLNPYGGGFVALSQTFSYDLEGNIAGEKGGADWKSITAGEGGVSGKLINPVDMKSGDCVKINFYANKKNGGKIKLMFLPYEGSPSYNKGKEIFIREEKGYASLCYMVGTPDVGPPKDFTLEEILKESNVRAQAVALIEIPEGVTATFLEFKKIS